MRCTCFWCHVLTIKDVNSDTSAPVCISSPFHQQPPWDWEMDNPFQSQCRITSDPPSAAQDAFGSDRVIEADIRSLFFSPSSSVNRDSTGQTHMTTGHPEASNHQWLVPTQDASLPQNVDWNDFEFSSASPFDFDAYPLPRDDAVEDFSSIFQTGFPLHLSAQHFPLPHAATHTLAVPAHPADSTTPDQISVQRDAENDGLDSALYSSLRGI